MQYKEEDDDDDFIAWLDEFQERGSGFVFKQITESTIYTFIKN